jgi:transcriptional regulator with XRE-family HTH domain
MSSFFSLAKLPIKERLFERLREARMRLGLKQSELAEHGEVSRVTQVSYETDATAPNTDYLRRVQAVGVDIPFVLFGEDVELAEKAGAHIDWKLVRESVEAVDFFCIKVAPNCPSGYRWQLIQQVYSNIIAARQSSDQSPPAANFELVRDAWERI